MARRPALASRGRRAQDLGCEPITLSRPVMIPPGAGHKVPSIGATRSRPSPRCHGGPPSLLSLLLSHSEVASAEMACPEGDRSLAKATDRRCSPRARKAARAGRSPWTAPQVRGTRSNIRREALVGGRGQRRTLTYWGTYKYLSPIKRVHPQILLESQKFWLSHDFDDAMEASGDQVVYEPQATRRARAHVYRVRLDDEEMATLQALA